MVDCKLIASFLLLLLHIVILYKQNDGVAITLHRNEQSDLHAGVVQEDKKYERLARIFETLKDRAQALKHGMYRSLGQVSKMGNNESVAMSLYGELNGRYSIKFPVGTPPQDLSLLVDTGSDLVWVPCTINYRCFNCSVKRANNSDGIFLPMMSSSHQFLTCGNPYLKNFCENFSRISGTNFSQSTRPEYRTVYVTGGTRGWLLSETLTLALEDKKRAIRHFAVGCSTTSVRQSTGIAGFDRGALSMPSQLRDQRIVGKDMFAYCFQHYQHYQHFDENKKTGVIVLGDKALPKDIPLRYTPLLINSRATRAYYIGLRGVSIGGKRLRLPSKYLSFDTKGNGGTVIDSGSTFTGFNKKIYDKIAAGFDSQIRYRRAGEVENTSFSGLCYDISGLDMVLIPMFTFHFKGGLDMVLPASNYFVHYGSSICLSMLSLDPYLALGHGPAVILGSSQQRDFYIL